VHEFGWSIGANTDNPSVKPDVCDRVRSTLTLKGARVSVSAGVTIDGLPPRTTGGYRPVSYELGYGTHTLSFGGKSSTVEVIDGPAHKVLLEWDPGELAWQRGRVAIAPRARYAANDGFSLEATLDGASASFGAWEWLD
jgi:hypothetical protein